MLKIIPRLFLIILSACFLCVFACYGQDDIMIVDEKLLPPKRCCFCFYQDICHAGNETDCKNENSFCYWEENSCKNLFKKLCEVWLNGQTDCDEKVVSPLCVTPLPPENCTEIRTEIEAHSNAITCSTCHQADFGDVITYCVNATNCSNVSITHSGCKTFRNLENAERWLHALASKLPPGVKLVVSANQTNFVTTSCGSTIQQTLTTFEVICDGFFNTCISDPTLPICPLTGTKCLDINDGTGVSSLICIGPDCQKKKMSCCIDLNLDLDNPNKPIDPDSGIWREGVECTNGVCKEVIQGRTFYDEDDKSCTNCIKDAVDKATSSVTLRNCINNAASNCAKSGGYFASRCVGKAVPKDGRCDYYRNGTYYCDVEVSCYTRCTVEKDADGITKQAQ